MIFISNKKLTEMIAREVFKSISEHSKILPNVNDELRNAIMDTGNILQSVLKDMDQMRKNTDTDAFNINILGQSVNNLAISLDKIIARVRVIEEELSTANVKFTNN